MVFSSCSGVGLTSSQYILIGSNVVVTVDYLGNLLYIKTMSRDVYILKNDILILREFAKQYMQIANDPIQESRRKLWHAHNSFDSARPLIQVSPFPFVLNIVENDLQCEDIGVMNGN